MEPEKSKHRPDITFKRTHNRGAMFPRSLLNTDDMLAWYHSHKVNKSTHYRTLHAGHLYFGVCSRQTQHNCMFVTINSEWFYFRYSFFFHCYFVMRVNHAAAI